MRTAKILEGKFSENLFLGGSAEKETKFYFKV
jgi:hypothetical protein